MRTGYTGGVTGTDKGANVRAVAYVRVSSEEQRKHGYSLDDQERELRVQIGLRDWELVEVVRDEGISGADPNRPGLRRIEELAGEGRCDVALATKRNRWFRDIEHRRRYERGLRRMGASIAALNDSGSAIADGVDDLLGEEQRREIARETRRGRRARARKGEVVAGVAPFGFRFSADRKTFEVEEPEATVVRRIFSMAAGGTRLSGIASALVADGVPTPRGFRGVRGSGDGKTRSRLVLRQIVLSDCYLPHPAADLAALVEAGNLDATVAERAPDPAGVWWFAWRGVEKGYEEEGGRREFWDNPEAEHIAVPIPDAGVPREQVEEARRRVLANRAHSNGGRRFWELSGGILHCPCGRRMASHTAKRKAGREFYYVCGLRRSNHGRCEHGTRYHRAGQTEAKVRSLVLGLLARPDEVRRRAEEYVRSEEWRLMASSHDLAGREERLRGVEQRRGALIDLAADGTITREDLRAKLAGLDAERDGLRRELNALRNTEEQAERLRELPELAEELARELPHLLDARRVVRDHDTIPNERTGENPLGIYRLTTDRIRHLTEEEVTRREQEAEDERAARYRAAYEDLGLRVIAHPDGTLEASWGFGEVMLRNRSDESKNKHATKHFSATEHPIVQSFQPGEDWIWCYIDEVVMEPRR
jgi:site-specific DNA recombinase